MMRSMKSTVLLIGWLLAAQSLLAADGPLIYERDVRPILSSRCYSCHGPLKQESGLRLDDGALIRRGGNSGPVLVPGNAAESLLIERITSSDAADRMPPEGKPPLSRKQIEFLGRWIDQGAQLPADSVNDRSAKVDHWSLRPIVRPKIPAIESRGWIRNPLDAFVLARLDAARIKPATTADRETLIRRLSFDLVGLPPTLSEVDAFRADNQPGAYERLVDRLLASPHYGERWGRHWLDVARYADSDGYNFDAPRSIWKYRDWVIDALNNDMPFDRFTVEQLAGDLLTQPSMDQRVATGFQRNTLYNQEGGNDPEQYRVERIVDRVHTMGTAFLGLTVGCAECHSHKYDPISQREFYQLFAFFNNADELELDFPTPSEAAQLAELAEKIERLRQRIVQWEQDHADDRAAWETHAEHRELRDEIGKLEKSKPKPVTTLVLTRRLQDPRATHMHLRGDFTNPGAVVQPGVPAALPPLPENLATPTRLDLAQWLVSDQQPLTARVTVNRVWQRLLGRGLVETENDFGTQGARPTHPQLLDWLADEFRRGGWQLKRLQRLIVTSATYRQSSADRPELAEVDDGNLLLARQRRLRLPGEVIRDSALWIGGLLSTKIGGPSVFPYQPDGIMELRRSPRPWEMSAGEDRYRRTMYTHLWRTSRRSRYGWPAAVSAAGRHSARLTSSDSTPSTNRSMSTTCTPPCCTCWVLTINSSRIASRAATFV